MSETVKVKVIELEKAELKPGAKYIICLDPQYGNFMETIQKRLDILIGAGGYVLLPIQGNSLKVYEVMPEGGRVSHGK